LSPSLPLSFFRRDTLTVAQELLGKLLVRRVAGETIVGRIVETEAYLADDPACHAYRGRTTRNAPMFAAGGISYVYFIYGCHFCFNVVSGAEGHGEAVLVRALEPVAGIEAMRVARGDKPLRQLCSGPGKLCQALRIGREDNALPLNSPPLRVADDASPAPASVCDVRIGIREGAELPYRFLASDNPYVSRGVRRS
jgi:DNA-3-methyladenine glycosylase